MIESITNWDADGVYTIFHCRNIISVNKEWMFYFLDGG